jgi:hypothetical protein
MEFSITQIRIKKANFLINNIQTEWINLGVADLVFFAHRIKN